MGDSQFQPQAVSGTTVALFVLMSPCQARADTSLFPVLLTDASAGQIVPSQAHPQIRKPSSSFRSNSPVHRHVVSVRG